MDTLTYTQELTSQLLLATILFDFLTGVARAVHEGKLNSTVGINGLIKHSIVVMLALTLGHFTGGTNMAWFGHSIVVGFAGQNLVSLMENWSLAGHEIPQALYDVLAKLPNSELTDAIRKELGDGVAIEVEREEPYHDKNSEEKLKMIQDKFTDKKEEK